MDDATSRYVSASVIGIKICLHLPVEVVLKVLSPHLVPSGLVSGKSESGIGSILDMSISLPSSAESTLLLLGMKLTWNHNVKRCQAWCVRLKSFAPRVRNPFHSYCCVPIYLPWRQRHLSLHWMTSWVARRRARTSRPAGALVQCGPRRREHPRIVSRSRGGYCHFRKFENPLVRVLVGKSFFTQTHLSK